MAAPKRTLSELESVVLGLIWAEGPCTAYAVRRIVQESLSTQWSGSAGAVYPAVARLEGRGLISSREQSTGQRKSQALAISAAGKRVLSCWLGPPVDPTAFGIPADPLRIRIRFLELLPVDAQLRFINEAITAIEASLQQIRADVRARSKQGSPFATAMARGAMHASRARLRTLTELRSELEGQPSK